MLRPITAFLIVLTAAGCGMKNTVSVTNGTESEILNISVSVCDITWNIESLAPGETRTFEADYPFDGHFRVSSPRQNGDFGYVTHGLTEDHAEIVFQEDGIDFSQTSGGY